LAAPAAKRYAAALERLRSAHVTLAFGAWHGDWQPYNMARVPGRPAQIALWDWERFALGVPLGFDPLHYLLQALLHGRGVGPDIAARFLTEAEADAVRGGAAPEHAAVVAAAY